MSNNHQISLQEAIDLTTGYRNNHPSDFFICETYEAGAIQALLAVPGCESLRIYLGRKGDNSVVTVLVAVNTNNEDILPVSHPATGEREAPGDGGGVLLEDGYRCPEFCPPKSVLNS